ncbi:MAG: hypothetical protein JXA15_14310 [Spirochaetales bacterium]|nr:hypothetical protein [Spirochaetales bacterium]
MIAAQDGARGTETFRPGAVRVFAYEGRDSSGLWRLSAGGTALLARGSGEPVPGARYRVLAEALSGGGVSFRVLGKASALPSAPPQASPAAPGAGAGLPVAAGDMAPALAAVLRALAREGLPLRLAPSLAKSAARSGDIEGAAGFLARAAALGNGEGLDEAVEAIFGRRDAADGGGGGAADGQGRGNGDRGREEDRGGRAGSGNGAPGTESAQGALIDAGTLDGSGFGRFLETLALGAPSSRARERGAWTFVPFAFELDGVEISGTLRLQLPDGPGGPGCIAASLRAGRARRPWCFRIDFGDGPSPRLAIGRDRTRDAELERAASRLAAEHGVASYKVLAPGERAEVEDPRLGTDERA